MTAFCVLVTGTRRALSGEERARVENIIRAALPKPVGFCVVRMGDCPSGVDAAARHYCEVTKIPHERHHADWAMSGKSAGPKRNQVMVDAGADLVLAFPDRNEHAGTWDCIRRAVWAGIPARVYPLG